MPETQLQDNSLKQYLIDEFVEDYQEGRTNRRDALKLLTGLVGASAAGALIAACAPATPLASTAIPTLVNPTAAPTLPSATSAPAAAATVAAPPGTALPDATLTTSATATISSGDANIHVAPDDPAIEASDITFPASDATLMAYLARPAGSTAAPAILVCHENRGLTDYIKDVTRRLAKAGYVALAVDLLSRQGGSAKQDQSAVPGLLGNMQPAQMVGDFATALNYLKGQSFVSPSKLGMTGFCFGGGITWRAATQIPELRAAVPFYGPNPPLEDVPKIQAAVLAHYGALDQRIDAGIPAIEQAMKQNNKVFEYHVYPGANHAFHNDTGASYNAAAATEAWSRTLAWFDEYVKG